MYVLPVPRDDLISFLPQQGVVAEIGVWRGDFSRVILKQNKPSKLHLIDPWRFLDLDDYRNDPTNSPNEEHEQNFQGVKRAFRRQEKKETVVFHRNLSTEAAPTFPDQYFDWIYLDGMHASRLENFVRVHRSVNSSDHPDNHHDRETAMDR